MPEQAQDPSPIYQRYFIELAIYNGSLGQEKRLCPDVYPVRATTRERVNSALKDGYGGRYVRVRGHAKVYCHLMFGILALTVEQQMRFAT